MNILGKSGHSASISKYAVYEFQKKGKEKKKIRGVVQILHTGEADKSSAQREVT